MVRKLVGFSVLAVVGLVGIKLVFGLLGFAISLIMSLLWLALIGFLFYMVLKVISPSAARRVREMIQGNAGSSEEGV